MSVEMAIQNRQRRCTIDVRFLKKITRAIIADEPQNICDHQIGILIVPAEKMAAFNRQFLQHSGSTDVITLEYDESDKTPDGMRRIQGDIIISIDDAIQQAKTFRTTWQSELVRYIIHGILHLRGYQDTKPAARRLMKREENRLLKEITRSFPLSRLGTRSRPTSKR
jgi:probable rRNA maturation factor